MAASFSARCEMRALRPATLRAAATMSRGLILLPGVSCRTRAKQFASPSAAPRLPPLRKAAPEPCRDTRFRWTGSFSCLKRSRT